MTDVTRLSVIGGQAVSDTKTEMLRRFDEKVAEMRAWLAETGGGGFALLGYDRDSRNAQPRVHSWVNYFCCDPGDAFWLPDMARTRIQQRVLGDD